MTEMHSPTHSEVATCVVLALVAITAGAFGAWFGDWRALLIALHAHTLGCLAWQSSKAKALQRRVKSLEEANVILADCCVRYGLDRELRSHS